MLSLDALQPALVADVLLHLSWPASNAAVSAIALWSCQALVEPWLQSPATLAIPPPMPNDLPLLNNSDMIPFQREGGVPAPAVTCITNALLMPPPVFCSHCHSHLLPLYAWTICVTTYKLLCGFSYSHTLNYTESNCIRVVGGCKMPLYWAKHEYIQYCLYILSPTSCNGNTPVTLSPTRLLYSLKIELKGTKLYPLGEYQRIEKK